MKSSKHQRGLSDASWLVCTRLKIAFQVVDPNTDLRNRVVSLQIIQEVCKAHVLN